MRARLFAACVLALLTLSCGKASSNISLTAPTTSRCDVAVANSISGSAAAAGTEGTLSVSTARDCTWSATTASAWINLTSSKSGQGDGAVPYRLMANPDPTPRRATIDVNSMQVLLVQDAAPCRYTVTPANTSVSANGGAVTIAIDTLTGCAWTAAADVPWIALPANASGGHASSSSAQAIVPAASCPHSATRSNGGWRRRR